MMKAKRPEYNLRAIYVRSSVLSMDDDFDPTAGGQQLTGQFRSHLSSYAFREFSDHLPDGTQQVIRSHEFTTTFAFRYQMPKIDDKEGVVMKTAASINVDFVSSYECVSPGEPSKEELEEFGKTSALVHVWPYFREYCSTTFQKMHLPAILIPLLVAKPPPATIKKTAQKKTKTAIGEVKSSAVRRKTTSKKASSG